MIIYVLKRKTYVRFYFIKNNQFNYINTKYVQQSNIQQYKKHFLTDPSEHDRIYPMKTRILKLQICPSTRRVVPIEIRINR